MLAIAVVAVTAAACGSSGTSASGPSGGASGSSSAAAKASKTYTVGLIVDDTGIAASGQKHVEDGMKAAIAIAAKQGYNIKYVVADTESSPAGALSAAQNLVQRQHVFAVIAHSALFFSAAAYLTRQHIPVIGAPQDGPEWITSKNMFATYGAIHTEKVATTGGLFLKQQGATNLGSVGYSISPSSAEASKASALSAKAVGLKADYVNSKFPFGSTDVQPIALAMKDAGIDAVTPEVDPNTSFALITALRNAGVDLKVALLPIGYGVDLLQAGPGTLKAAQNVYFSLQYEPVELHTKATEAFVAALKATGGTTAPGLPTYDGYASILMLVQGLQGAGANPTQASLIASLSKIHDFNPGGLYGAHPLDINDRVNIVAGADGCEYYIKLTGSTFEPVKNADPLCGTIVAGETVTP
ncbi:MAG TPA: ABC transporter substrate-binding protein [Frankiaceae bacterium]|nr:ABC transporter substrate-binding protein [Frankiaceae bacterium]